MKQLLPASEIQRNKRVAELMKNRQQKENQQPKKLTQEEMFEVKGLMREGRTREEAIKIVLETNKLLNKKTNNNLPISNWNSGGFINDEKYKQPIKHRTY